MRVDGKIDAKKYLESLGGSLSNVMDMATELVLKVPTKSSVEQVEILRREAEAQARQLKRPVTIDLPDYQYEDKYRAVCIDYTKDVWSIEVALGNGQWKPVH